MDVDRYPATGLRLLAQAVRQCRACPGLNIPGETQAAPGYGSPQSPVFIVGQSLCKPCMETQVPFTGGSGRFVDQSFERAGVSKADAFITNVVHCHPPGNRPSREYEINNCSTFLRQELRLIKPRLVVCLGRDARQAIADHLPYGEKLSWPLPPLPASGSHRKPLIIFAPHPSWVMRQPAADRERFVVDIARAITWGFADIGCG